jgi:hypothetical protein
MEELRDVIKRHIRNLYKSDFQSLLRFKNDPTTLEQKKNELFIKCFQPHLKNQLRDECIKAIHDNHELTKKNKSTMIKIIDNEFNNQQHLRSRFDLEVRRFLDHSS